VSISVQEATLGDDFAETVRPLLGLMARVSRRIVRDEDLADDVIQEALLSFWTCQVTPPNPRAWLLRAVTLRSLQLARTSRRRRKHEKHASLSRPEWSVRDDPSRELDRQEFVHLFREALGQVKEEYRVVFALWAFEEMDYASIAESLGIPIGTVRSRLSRSRHAIRESVSEIINK
jgi:RNA polymerase sigma factor (sigma-70 family)